MLKFLAFRLHPIEFIYSVRDGLNLKSERSLAQLPLSTTDEMVFK